MTGIGGEKPQYVKGVMVALILQLRKASHVGFVYIIPSDIIFGRRRFLFNFLGDRPNFDQR
jgi:hypothetical protein